MILTSHKPSSAHLHLCAVLPIDCAMKMQSQELIHLARIFCFLLIARLLLTDFQCSIMLLGGLEDAFFFFFFWSFVTSSFLKLINISTKFC